MKIILKNFICIATWATVALIKAVETLAEQGGGINCNSIAELLHKIATTIIVYRGD